MLHLYQILKVYPFQENVNFGYGISSKIPEVLGKVKMKILTYLFIRQKTFPLMVVFQPKYSLSSVEKSNF